MDLSTTLEAHVQRLKRYSDASLMRPVQLLEEVRNEQNECVLDHFLDWRINRSNLHVELKCRWRGSSDAWDTYEDVETHLWTNKVIEQDILKYLDSKKGDHPVMRDLLGRLRSQLSEPDRENDEISIPVRKEHGHNRGRSRVRVRGRGRGRGRERGRGRKRSNKKIRRKPRNKPAIYQRPSGGWVARDLGSQRFF